MDIVRQLVRDDGGEGSVEEVVPGEHGLGIFNTLLRDPARFDATWVFMPWEVRAPRPRPSRGPGPELRPATAPLLRGRRPARSPRAAAAAAAEKANP